MALKIRPSRDGHAREESLGEARILPAISPHPALPLVREDFFESGGYVVALDWVDGIDLGTLLADRGRPLSAESRSARFPSASEPATRGFAWCLDNGSATRRDPAPSDA